MSVKNSERQDTIQRIQVGVVGVVAVLLLVSVANFVMQRASDEQSAIEEIQDDTLDDSRAAKGGEEEAPAEPLAEMGVTPTVPVEEDKKAAEVKKKVAPISRGAVEGQVVPDLKPDPKLEAPMDRETQ